MRTQSKGTVFTDLPDISFEVLKLGEVVFGGSYTECFEYMLNNGGLSVFYDNPDGWMLRYKVENVGVVQ